MATSFRPDGPSATDDNARSAAFRRTTSSAVLLAWAEPEVARPRRVEESEFSHASGEPALRRALVEEPEELRSLREGAERLSVLGELPDPGGEGDDREGQQVQGQYDRSERRRVASL